MLNQAELTFESEQWTRILKKLENRWEDIKLRKEFGGVVSSIAFADIIEHFKDQKGPNGTWDGWSPLYEKHLQKIGKSGRNILQTGTPANLRMKITPKGKNYRPTSDGIILYNNAKTSNGFAYAQHHDEGRSSYKGNPRSFMWLSSKAIDSMIRQTIRWLKEGL